MAYEHELRELHQNTEPQSTVLWETHLPMLLMLYCQLAPHISVALQMEDDAEEWDVRRSLFDNHMSESMQSNLEYMWKKFGFCFPEADLLSDPEGLLRYLVGGPAGSYAFTIHLHWMV